MCSCDQSLLTLAFLWEKFSQLQFYEDLTRKTAFFTGWSWFKFNNLRLALGTNLKFYTSVAKELKLKARKVWGLIPTFVEITGEKLVGGFLPSPILNRVKPRVMPLKFGRNAKVTLVLKWRLPVCSAADDNFEI